MHLPDDPKSLSDNTVLALFEDNNSILWIGTAEGGLNRFNRKTEKFDHYKYNADNPKSLSDNTVLSIYQDKTGILWIGTGAGGLNKLNKNKKEFKHHLLENPEKQATIDNVIWAIHEDKLGFLWVGTHSSGLFKINRDSGKIKNYTNDPNNPKGLSNNQVRVIHEDHNGTIWIGTYGGGLNRYQPINDSFIHYRRKHYSQKSISSNAILDILGDQKGRLWIGTYGGGLNIFDKNSQTFHCFTEKDGLPSNVIYGILEDSQEHLWMSTSRGLSKFDLKTKQFINYDYQDGLQSDEFNAGAYFQTAKGEMFFGGINGFSSFYPNLVQANLIIPPIVITEFKINNYPVLIQKNGILRQHINVTQKLELTYRDKYIFFSFAALDFSNPRKNQFAFKLENRDEHWIDLGTVHSLNFSNLDPGSYKLKIKAANNDGIWNEEGLSLNIHISPPFWKTFWFKTVLIFFFLFIAVLAYKKRTKYLLLQKSKEAVFDYLCQKNNISEREKEIIRLILKAKKSKEIAEFLFISPHTVKHHISNIYQKLGVNSRLQIIRFFDNS